MKMLVVLSWWLVIWLGVALLVSVPTWLLWNWLIPPIFGLPDITLLQAFGLLALTSCLFGRRVKVEAED